MESVLNSMPAYPENRESVLTRRLQSKGEEPAAAPASRPKAVVQSGANAPPPVPTGAPVMVDLLSLDEPAPVSSATIGIPDDAAENISTVGDAIKYIDENVKK